MGDRLMPWERKMAVESIEVPSCDQLRAPHLAARVTNGQAAGGQL